MNKKSIFLIITFVLPVAIFVFLKLAGKNQFEIPVYYSAGIDSLTSICHHDYSKPYEIPDSILTSVKWKQKECSLFILASHNELELKRLNGVFSKEQYSNYFLNTKSREEGLLLDSAKFNTWRNCIFIAPTKTNIVLMDKQRRIRGYYSIGSREEMDRLIVEMKILLKQF